LLKTSLHSFLGVQFATTERKIELLDRFGTVVVVVVVDIVDIVDIVVVVAGCIATTCCVGDHALFLQVQSAANKEIATLADIYISWRKKNRISQVFKCNS